MALGWSDFYNPGNVWGGAADLGSGLLQTGKDMLVAPNSYDAAGNLADSRKKAGQVFDASMAGMKAATNAPTVNIRAQQIATPDRITAERIAAERIAAPDAITARDVVASGLVSGPQADAIRQQQLDQAADAAQSPSAAAAQMRAAGAQIARQQLGQAAMARGADRAGARRAAMLATGEQGLQAAQITAAMAAEEQAKKQAAYTAALAGVRAGDVAAADAATRADALNQAKDITVGQANMQGRFATAQANQQAELQAATNNQLTGLQSQELTGNQRLQAAKANQESDLTAQRAQAEGRQKSWEQMQTAQQGWAELANQSTGAQNQAQGVAAGYGSNQNQVRQQQGGAVAGLVSTGLSLAGPLSDLSDEMAKTEIAPIGSRFGARFDNRFDGRFGGAGPLSGLSDENAKREVERMGEDEIADWAEAVPTVAFRYRSGIPGTDGGDEYHTGTLAGELQRTGPLGKLMVHRREDGMKEVEYGPLGLMVGKGALSRANEALDWAKAAYAMAAGKGLVRG